MSLIMNPQRKSSRTQPRQTQTVLDKEIEEAGLKGIHTNVYLMCKYI